MATRLLKPDEVDRLLRLPMGRAGELALAGQISFIELPGGQIRFEEREISKLIASGRRGVKRSREREALSA